MIFKGKRWKEVTKSGNVYDEKYSSENRALENTTEAGM